MKNYEKLEFTIEKLSSEDVIATSDPITGDVDMPWQIDNSKSIDECSFEILQATYMPSYLVVD